MIFIFLFGHHAVHTYPARAQQQNRKHAGQIHNGQIQIFDGLPAVVHEHEKGEFQHNYQSGEARKKSQYQQHGTENFGEDTKHQRIAVTDVERVEESAGHLAEICNFEQPVGYEQHESRHDPLNQHREIERVIRISGR